MDCRWHHGSSVHDSRYLAETDYITADAKAKKQETNSTVTYKVKGSTLTIKGSGSMSASMKFGSKKKPKRSKRSL